MTLCVQRELLDSLDSELDLLVWLKVTFLYTCMQYYLGNYDILVDCVRTRTR